MIRSDSSNGDMFKSYLQHVPSGPTEEQSFLEQYILAIFLLRLETILALQCHRNTQGFTQIKLLSRHWELCQEKSNVSEEEFSSKQASGFTLLGINRCILSKFKRQRKHGFDRKKEKSLVSESKFTLDPPKCTSIYTSNKASLGSGSPAENQDPQPPPPGPFLPLLPRVGKLTGLSQQTLLRPGQRTTAQTSTLSLKQGLVDSRRNLHRLADP